MVGSRLADLSSRLSGRQWRSLDELADTPEFQAWVEDEFPERASLLTLDRRKFFQVMGASLALAGLTGCRFLPQRRAVPFVQAVEDLVPGKPRYYATAVVLAGIGTGVLARSNDGRPTKLEGNPLHPGSLGATDAITQATLLDLYDPDRTRNVLRNGAISTWDAFLADVRATLASQRAARGAGVRILTGAITSPTLADQIQRLLDAYPEARWYQWEAVNRDNVRAGTEQAFGRPLNPVYSFDTANVVLTLDADPLDQMPGHVRYARDIMSGRVVRPDARSMNRLYAVESVLSNMGATADHRLPVRPREVGTIAVAIARRLGLDVPGVTISDAQSRWVDACVADLKANKGQCVVVVGDHQPPALHALAARMNEELGAVGSAVSYTEPLYPNWHDALGGLSELTDDMDADKVRLLIMLGVNPVYDAPADVPFGKALKKVGCAVHLGLRKNETSELSRWHVPEAHSLEAWGDCRAYDGTASVIQPIIRPLFGGKSAIELIASLAGRPRDGYQIVREHWRSALGTADFDRRWRRAIHDGLIEGTEFPTVSVRVQSPDRSLRGLSEAIAPGRSAGLEVAFAPDPTIWDGRFASNGWLQELPKPITRLTWDNAALIAPSTAQAASVADGDLVELQLRGRTVVAPAKVQPGQPKDLVTLHLGYGRSQAGAIGSLVGFSAGALRTRDAMWFTSGISLRRTGRRYTFAKTEHHHAIRDGKINGTQGRDIVRVMPFAEMEADEQDANHAASHEPAHGGEHPSLYPRDEHAYDGHRWGMSIDLSLCTGCNACVIACQAENNIPVVGKEQVLRGREMHWIRIDRYYEGDPDDPTVHHQPVLCMHCENAPCEPVCPVAATVHSHEGLNQMVYNRCVGTRYCSNNCPYKVRRFNFLNYANHHDVPIKQLLQNPNVTVRGRGVMEKCTFCVQRINAARIEAKKQGRPVRDGEVVTACQAACPPQAIVFGDIADPNSAVSRAKRESRDYSLLDDLNTRPRLTYLAKLTNKHPQLEKSA
ncbi:MAG: TAT-variant-translocated molybdopterin oxidoreductase [Chthonomonadales bacterium]|nr:TAT-variant-translocated molybdopterin oxidoreductase [Chthonomonadales bacterium]